MGTAAKTLAHLGATAVLRAGVVLAGFTATAMVAGVAWGAQDVALSMQRPRGGAGLVIEGSIAGVVAGGPSAALRLTLRNPGDVARAVSSVTATSTGLVRGPASCGAGDYLSVGGWTGAVTVPAGGARSVTLPVTFSDATPPECASATWGLAYTAH